MADYSAIDVAGMEPQILRDQPAPQLIWAPIEDLVVDRSYQREISTAGRRLIKQISADFDWARCAPILLAALPGGKYAVVDGQHRAHAAKICGIEALPAMVVPMSVQQQAAAFVAVNNKRVGVNIQAVFRAALAAGDDWALRCDAAVSQAGCSMATFCPTSQARQPKVIYATGLIKRMVQNGEATAISAGLAAIVSSDQAAELGAYSGATLAVWLPALAQNQRFLKLQLTSIFDSIDFEDLLGRCRQKARTVGGSGRGLAIAQVAEHLTLAVRQEAA